MSIFRKHKTVADRSAADRARHKKKIEKAIKAGIKDVVAEESIIGQNGKKKIKIPVRGLKEFRFIYGDNDHNKQAGSAGDKQIKKGQGLSHRRKKPTRGSKQRPGKDVGEEYYEVEVTLEELADYLFADLELPELERKKFKFVTDEKWKRKGYRSKGIRPRLSKKETLKRRIRRKKAAERAGTYDPESEERFPFHESDLKYKHMKVTKEESNAAVIFFLMDVSGSMTKEKKYLARSYYFLLYQFLRHKYENIEVVFISHTTEAKETNEDDFFKVGSTGGTKVSTAFELAETIIEKRFHPTNWNVYIFYSGDGENWPEDNKKAIASVEKLKNLARMTVYAEIDPFWTAPDRLNIGSHLAQLIGETPFRALWGMLDRFVGKHFKKVRITAAKDIWPAFNRIFGGKDKE